jgi:hypothetical protein
MKEKNEIMLEKSARILRLDKDNASFGTKNGFVFMTLCDDGEEKQYDRIFLHRAFPHEFLYEYISVVGDDGKEIGLIYSIEDFDDGVKSVIKTEIDRKYYAPTIKDIKSVKERYGFSYWKVIFTNGKSASFTMQDTFKNLLHTGDDSIVLVDVDGNRYKIESVSELTAKSYRKIEIYL